MGKSKKSTRFYLRWRLDQDYWAKLTTEERAWLAKFNGEFYRCEFAGDALHDEKAQQKELYQAQNAAARDVITASTTDVTRAVTSAVADRPSLRARFYTPADYRAPAGGGARGAAVRTLEDELVDLLEDTRQRMGDAADIVDLFNEIQGHRRAG